MYKILVLGVVFSLQLGGILGLVIPEQHLLEKNYNDSPEIFLPPFEPQTSRDFESSEKSEPTSRVRRAAEDSKIDRRNFNNLVKDLNELISSSTRDNPTELRNSVNTAGKQLSSEYLVTKGVGAHKLHLRKLPWNKAREVCIDEGGQLADIRSDSEEKIVLRMLAEDSVDSAWIGYHDIFEEGDWVSVLGEPLGKSGWDRWWKGHLPNPDNQDGDEDCACLMKDGGGMNDNKCSREMAFVCKITDL